MYVKEKNRKRWRSEVKNCDLCGEDLRSVEFFVDGKTIHGPWGLMCPKCFSKSGCGLGTGLGQKYEAVEPFYKIEG